MIPKIDYEVHDVLVDVFLKPRDNRRDFYKESERFVKHFNKIEKEVLASIEKFSGFSWTKRKIPVYLIPSGNSRSFARSKLKKELSGVVQKVHKEIKRVTHIFIHELVHVNQFQGGFFSKRNKFVYNKKREGDGVKLELVTNLVCLFVLRDVFGEDSLYEKDFWEFIKVVRSSPEMRDKFPAFSKKWDLNKKPFKDYIFS